MPKEEPTSRVSRIRGGLPGEDWRNYVSTGAEKAHDNANATALKEAKQLRHKGRLVAAHKREKRAYRIRVRGYDRKRKGEDPLRKGITTKTLKLGPFERSTKEIRLGKPSKAEERRKTIQAVGSSIGGVRTLAALGAGAGITGVVQETKDKSKKVADKTKGLVQRSGGKEEVVTSKSLDIYDIIGKSYDDPFDPEGLVEIAKFLASPAGKLFSRYSQAAQKGFQHGGVEGATNATKKVFGRTGGWHGIGGAANESLGTTGKVGLGAAGVGAGLYGAAKLAKPFVKKKALKYAGYGALGLGGTVAAGTAVGNMAGGR